jgi:hypothetical protein
MAEYDDGRVACTEQEIIIRSYYFPVGDKRVRYQDIREVRSVRLGVMGKWRIWGSSDLLHWFNFDPKRPGKDTALVLYLDGAGVRPVITPDDAARVTAVLSAHDVNVTAGHEAGLI